MINRFPLLPILFSMVFLAACKQENVKPETEVDLYFPEAASEWETLDPTALNWDAAKLEELYTYLAANGTRAFIILKDGKIVIEKYWGQALIGGGDFTRESNWYWASAGKSLTATLVGIAQQEGLLSVADRTSDHLGIGWTSASMEKENIITIKDQLSMTTGLDYEVANIDCTLPECLNYKEDAGQQWYYHNAPYTLLEEVVSAAAGTNYNSFTTNQLSNKIGMQGLWVKGEFNNVYYSNARSAARFGLFILAEGRWAEVQILTDNAYYQEMVNSSQALNPAYGYLWWLNGKEQFLLPGSTFKFNGQLASNAPSDLFAAMGKNGQFINVIPSEKMVVVRMGEAPDNALVPILFHDEMWRLIQAAKGNAE